MNQSKKHTKPLKKKSKNNISTPILLIILVAVIGFAYYKFANRQAKVSGTVVHGETNKSILNVRVVLDSQRAIKNNSTTGVFNFSSINAGPHTLLFQKPGFKSLSQTFTLKPGEAKKIRISLKPKETKKDPLFGTFFGVVSPKGKSIQVFNAQDYSKYYQFTPEGSPKDFLFYQNKLFTADFDSDTITIFNIENKKKISTLQLPNNSETSHLIRVDNHLLIFNFLSKTVYRLNLKHMTLESTETVLPSNPRDIKVVEGRVFVLHSKGMSIVSPTGEIDSSTSIANIKGESMVYNNETNQLMIPNGKELVFVDVNSESVERFPLQVSASEIAYSRQYQEIYLGDKSTLTILDAFTREYKEKEIATGGEHLSDLTLSPNQKQLLATHRASKNITVFEIEERKIIKTLRVGGYPTQARFFNVTE